MWNRSSGNFCSARAQWPGRNRGKPLIFCAPEILCLTQGVTPVMGVRGKATMSTKCSSEPVPIPSVPSGHLPLIRGVGPGAFCPIPRCSRRSPAKRVRREEEEQGNERSFRRQAETEWSGLCDDEPPWAKSLAARRWRNSPCKTIKPCQTARRIVTQASFSCPCGAIHLLAPYMVLLIMAVP